MKHHATLLLLTSSLSAVSAQTFSVTSGPCTVSGNCVQSAGYDGTTQYGDSDSCAVDVANSYDLQVIHFSVQAGTGNCENDYLQITDATASSGSGVGATKWCNTDNPLSAGGTITMSSFMCGANYMGSTACELSFSSNGDGTRSTGFKLCQNQPPSPAPPSLPFPPFSPPSPKPPGMLCTNECLDKNGKKSANTAYLRNDGSCSDGGLNHAYGFDAKELASQGGGSGLQWGYDCKFGTDCADCGARSVCTNCPTTCATRSGEKGHAHTCWADMYNNGYCDVACNNWECGHDADDCTEEDIMQQCRLGHGTGYKHLKSKPGNVTGIYALGSNSTNVLADVELVVTSADPILLNLNEDTNTWTLSLSFKLAMRWRDTRVKTMACKKVLPKLLSVESIADDSDRIGQASSMNLLWTPKLMIEGNSLTFVPDSVTKARAIVDQTFNHWPDATNAIPFVQAAPDGATACTDCVGLNMTVSIDVDQHPALFFGQYPFDHQVFRFQMSATGANFFTCETLFDHSKVDMASVVPSSGEWIAYKLESVPMIKGGLNDSATGAAAQPLSMACDIRLHAHRNYIIFTIKQILPSIIVVYTGLFSMYLSAADHTGDRIAAIMVSILILMVNFQSDLGIGKITYLVWWDVFNLVSMGVLAVVMLEALYEHLLITSDQEARCLIINRVLRVAFSAFIYPSVLVWLLLFGLQGSGTALGWTILALGVSTTWLFSIFFIRRMSNMGVVDRNTVIAKLQAVDLSDRDALEEALEQAFTTFDLDNSGRLDIDEVRDLLTNLFKDRIVTEKESAASNLDLDGDGKISKFEFTKLLLHVKTFADGDGTFSLQMLIEALTYATNLSPDFASAGMLPVRRPSSPKSRVGMEVAVEVGSAKPLSA